jgi:hypothetical protein
MTIDEIKTAKWELQLLLIEEFKEFERKTGTRINSIDIKRIDSISKEIRDISFIGMDVKVDI